MELFNSLTFDGVNSLDSGIYITGEAVYNAPQRQVEMITVPGRNGTLAIDQGRFENIEVTYPAGCFADNQTDFAEKVRAFRNELASRFGYKRLVDTYHPDEFRLGTYSSGLEVGAVGYHRAGEFDITFDCKPQRFLVSGEEAVTIGEWGETETATGDIVEIDNPDGTLGVKSLLVTIDPIQSGSGTPSPDNVRPISGRTEVETIVSPTTSATDGQTYTTALGRTVYGGTLDVVSGVLTVTHGIVDLGSLPWTKLTNMSVFYADIQGGPFAVNGGNDGLCSIYPIFKGQYSAMTDKAVTIANSTFSSAQGRTAVKDTSYSSASASDFKTAMNGVQLVYELATPQTYQLTPQQIDLLLGDNNVWSDGRIAIEYGLLPNIIVNPTLFASNPLLVVTGSGTLSIGNQTLTIASGSADQVIYIDCDSQEAWEIVGGGKLSRNDYIQNAGESFPVLNPGANNIILGTGITRVEIVPRWWRI